MRQTKGHFSDCRHNVEHYIISISSVAISQGHFHTRFISIYIIAIRELAPSQGHNLCSINVFFL